MAQSREQERAQRRARWAEHVAAWRRSGLSQAEFCRRHGLKPPDFSWWKHEFARRAEGTSRAEFIPVRLATSVSAYPYEVCLRSGQTLRMASGFDPAAVRALLELLGDGATC